MISLQILCLHMKDSMPCVTSFEMFHNLDYDPCNNTIYFGAESLLVGCYRRV